MSSLTSYGRQYIAKTLFGKTWPIKSTYYVAAVKMQPNSSSTGSNIVEPTAVDYGRLPIVNTSSSFFESGIGRVYNADEIEWDVAENDWGWITHWALCDSLNGGNVIMFNQLANKVNIKDGDTLIIAGSGLSIGVYG
jgi:hypothetical protein